MSTRALGVGSGDDVFEYPPYKGGVPSGWSRILAFAFDIAENTAISFEIAVGVIPRLPGLPVLPPQSKEHS